MAHFSKFLGSGSVVQSIRDLEKLFLHKVSSIDAAKMVVDVTDEEIKPCYV